MLFRSATAVAVGAATFSDPYAPLRILEELEAICDRQGVKSVTELTGAIQPW